MWLKGHLRRSEEGTMVISIAHVSLSNIYALWHCVQAYGVRRIAFSGHSIAIHTINEDKNVKWPNEWSSSGSGLKERISVFQDLSYISFLQVILTKYFYQTVLMKYIQWLLSYAQSHLFMLLPCHPQASILSNRCLRSVGFSK